VTTVENEYPFLAYVEESGGADRLAERGQLLVYTAGFPTPALASTLNALAVRRPDLAFRHWGDADLGGLRIWRFLRERLGKPLALFRTTAAWAAAEAEKRGRVLPARERAALERLRSELHGQMPLGQDVVEAASLATVTLEAERKVEQERF
jgi:hypothetical protein